MSNAFFSEIPMNAAGPDAAISAPMRISLSSACALMVVESGSASAVKDCSKFLRFNVTDTSSSFLLLGGSDARAGGVKASDVTKGHARSECDPTAGVVAAKHARHVVAYGVQAGDRLIVRTKHTGL